jgi:hypothetical protein
MNESIANLQPIISSDVDSTKYVLEKQILSTKKVYGLYNERGKEGKQQEDDNNDTNKPLIITSYRKRRSN